MQHEEIVKEINDLHVAFDTRRQQTLDQIKLINQKDNIEINTDEVDELLGYIAAALLKTSEQFKMGETQTYNNSKLFEDGHGVSIRGYKCRTLNRVYFLCDWSKYKNEVYPFLPANFPKLVEDVKNKLDTFQRNVARKFNDVVEKAVGNIPVATKVYWKNGDDKLDLFTPTTVKEIEVIFKPNGGYYKEQYKLRFILDAKDGTHRVNLLGKNQHFALVDDAFFEKVKESLNFMRKHSEELEARKDKVFDDINQLIEDAGYKKYLMLRNI